MTKYQELLANQSVQKLIEEYPIIIDFLKSYDLFELNMNIPLSSAISGRVWPTLQELNLSEWDIEDLLIDFLEASEATKEPGLESIRILGGTDKAGKAETDVVDIHAGEVVSLVGPTGAGKSQLLMDIECGAKGETPSGRMVLYDGKMIDDEKLASGTNHYVAQLTQNMNFVIDVSVEEFLKMHAHSRGHKGIDTLVLKCFDMANELSGERFSFHEKVTRLSGGQARALMIADAHIISPSPVLLIDEIENAGIDRLHAVELLSGGGKIIFMATHDPLLALSTPRRIVLRNGGIYKVIKTTDEEKKHVQKLQKIESYTSEIRDQIRKGEEIKNVGTV